MNIPRPALLISVLALWIACGCASLGHRQLDHQTGESVVLVGHEPATLAFKPAKGQPIRVRSTYQPGAATVEYRQDVDYSVDLAKGMMWRTPNSRIPDFRTNTLFGQTDFDHTKFPGFGNTRFFAYIDYAYRPGERWPAQPSQTDLMPVARARLLSGKPVKLVAFGDSITAGGDATRPELIFWQRWADDLRRKYPRATITAVNGATGGDSTAHGLQRLQAKVLDEQPNLVLIAFGMNDHNKSGVPLPQFERNLREMITRIRSRGQAEIILLSAFPPNPNWKFGSHRMAEYAGSTRKVAVAMGCPYANVFDNWQSLAERKKPEDLLGNNINHPNDFGHWIYFRVLSEMGL